MFAHGLRIVVVLLLVALPNAAWTDAQVPGWTWLPSGRVSGGTLVVYLLGSAANALDDRRSLAGAGPSSHHEISVTAGIDLGLAMYILTAPMEMSSDK